MVMRSMLLRNSHVRVLDKFFGDVWSHGFRNPFAVLDTVLESIMANRFRQNREPNSRSTRWFPLNIKLQRTQTVLFTKTW